MKTQKLYLIMFRFFLNMFVGFFFICLVTLEFFNSSMQNIITSLKYSSTISFTLTLSILIIFYIKKEGK